MDNNIEIVVQDKVDSSISTKLKSIAFDAKEAHSAIAILTKEMSKLGGSSVTRLQSEFKKVTNEIDKIKAKLKAGDYRAVINIETRQSNLKTGDYVSQINSENRALEAQQKILQGNAVAEANDAAAKDRILNKINPLRRAYLEYAQSIRETNRLLEQGVISQRVHARAIDQAQVSLQNARVQNTQWQQSLLKTNNTTQLSRQHLVNLGYQLNDIFVSLASGQKPLTVFIQQGSQIGGIASAAGVSMGAMARAAAMMLVPFLPLIAVLGAAVGAFALLKKEINKDSGLKVFVADLNLTSKELKKFLTELGMTKKEIKNFKGEFEVGYGSIFKGIFKTISDDLDKAFDTKDIATKFFDWIEDRFLRLLGVVGTVCNGIFALNYAAFNAVINIWKALPNLFGEFFVNGANIAITALQGITDKSTDLVNAFIHSLNSLPKGLFGFDIIPEFTKKQLPKLENEYKGSFSKIGDNMGADLKKGWATGKSATSDFFKDVKKNAINFEKDKLKNAAKSILEDRANKSDKAAERRALTLAKINAELDNELNRMFALRPEREAQAKFDSIMEKMIGKKIKLTDEETKSIWNKIKAIQEATLAQQIFDNLYDDIEGPSRIYFATLKAGDELLKKNLISQEKLNAVIQNADEKYKAATNSMYEYNKNLKEQLRLGALPTNQRGVETEISQLKDEQLKQKNILPESEVENLRKVLSLRQELASISDDPIGLGAQMDRYQEYYKTLEEMRASDLVSEKTYSAYREKLIANENKLKLDYASDFFGNFASLQNSSNAKIADIGKTAAIAQALINTYVAATKAYAEGGPYLGPALAAAVVAAGMANVAAIRGVAGFMEGGWTGRGSLNEVAGVVHKREYVMDAASTQKIGVANLDRLRSGAAQVARNGASVGKAASGQNGSGNAQGATKVDQPVNVNVPFTAVVVQSKEAAMSALKSSEGRAFIIETLQKNRQTVAKIVGVK